MRDRLEGPPRLRIGGVLPNPAAARPRPVCYGVRWQAIGSSRSGDVFRGRIGLPCRRVEFPARAAPLGITLEDVQGILLAVAPVVGTPRIVAAAGNLASALGFAIAVAEAELEAEAEAED